MKKNKNEEIASEKKSLNFIKQAVKKDVKEDEEIEEDLDESIELIFEEL